MDPLYAELLRLVASAVGAALFPMVNKSPTIGHWLTTFSCGFALAAFAEPLTWDFVINHYGGRLKWLSDSPLHGHLALSLLIGLLGYLLVRATIYVVDAVLPNNSDNIIMQWILLKLRKFFGNEVVVKPDPKMIRPDSDLPATR